MSRGGSKIHAMRASDSHKLLCSTKCEGVARFLKESSAMLIGNYPQVEMHPGWNQKNLIPFCREKVIHVTAYSPLGGPGLGYGRDDIIADTYVVEEAKRLSKTPAQVRGDGILSRRSGHFCLIFSTCCLGTRLLLSGGVRFLRSVVQDREI